jgi:hypothetical protein
MPKEGIKKKQAPKKSYLTKRVLFRAITKGFRHIAEDAMKQRGHIVIAKDGWIVKVMSDGTEERISKITKASSKRIMLDQKN